MTRHCGPAIFGIALLLGAGEAETCCGADPIATGLKIQPSEILWRPGFRFHRRALAIISVVTGTLNLKGSKPFLAFLRTEDNRSRSIFSMISVPADNPWQSWIVSNRFPIVFRSISKQLRKRLHSIVWFSAPQRGRASVRVRATTTEAMKAANEPNYLRTSRTTTA